MLAILLTLAAVAIGAFCGFFVGVVFGSRVATVAILDAALQHAKDISAELAARIATAKADVLRNSSDVN